MVQRKWRSKLVRRKPLSRLKPTFLLLVLELEQPTLKLRLPLRLRTSTNEIRQCLVDLGLIKGSA